MSWNRSIRFLGRNLFPIKRKKENPIMHDIVALTKDLIRFKTMHSNPDEIRTCAQFIGDYLKSFGAEYTLLESNGVPSVLALPKHGHTPIVLMSHIDVVDAPDDLFEPKEKRGKLYGRGALDDKYAVALSLVLFKTHFEALRKQGKTRAEMPFGVLITGDEEVGGSNGVQHALKQFKADFAIALDGGGLNNIVVKEKGIFRLKLIGRGKAAHGSTPWLGDNAVENLMADYERIRGFFEPSELGYDAEDHWHRTLNLGMIQAGKSINQVPDYAEAQLDIRFTEHDDMDRIFKQMKKRIGGELVLVSKAPLFYAGESPYLDLLLEVAQGAKTGTEHGASDARYLSDHGIPGVVWGADGDRSHHAADEHIGIDSVLRLYDILNEYMNRSVVLGK